MKDLQLSNGEKLPTLEQYLKRAKKLKNVRLILELKAHETPERNREAAKAVVDMVKRMKLAKRTDYISFNMDACKEFIRLCPKSEVSYLNGELSPMELKEFGFTGLDYHYKVLQSHPDWVKDCKVLGMTSNVWTVDDPKLMEEMIDLGVDFITTDLPEETQKYYIRGSIRHYKRLRSFVCCLSCRLALPVFCLLQAVELPKRNSCGLVDYGLWSGLAS